MGPYTIHAQRPNGKVTRTRTQSMHLLDITGRERLNNGAARVWATNAMGETVLDSANGDFVEWVATTHQRACPWCDGGSDPDVWDCGRCHGTGLLEPETITMTRADYEAWTNPPAYTPTPAPVYPPRCWEEGADPDTCIPF